MPGSFDCDWCRFGVAPPVGLPSVTEETRRRAHCGWMDESQWVGDKPDLTMGGMGRLGCRDSMVGAKPSGAFDGVEWTENICPGWVVHTPAIVEIAEAFTASQMGVLRELFPDLSNVVAEGILEMKRSMDAYDRASLAAMKETNKNG